MTFTVAIVGRPNVGKSTLFNRLAGKTLALVHERPGVTRDRRVAPARLGDLRFSVIDTAGLEEAPPKTLEARMLEQTRRALAGADLALFVIDARAGVTAADRHFAQWVRESRIPVVLVANKCEGGAGEAGVLEAYGLGFGEPVAISAAHGEGMDALYEAIRPLADLAGAALEAETEASPERPIRIAIVGRPNVGKSTLVNRLVGEERVVTGPEPGITREAILVPWRARGQAFELVDTAGLRRRARVTDELEKLSAGETLRAIRLAEIVVLVLDAQAMLEHQDLEIARMAADEGRAIVIGVNKWDLVKDRRSALRRLREGLELSLPQIRGVPFVLFSALTGENIEALVPALLAAYEAWNRRVPTAVLNRFLAATLDRHPPPAPAGKPIHIRYMTQVKARPPTFALFVSRAGELPESYLRYLANALRQELGFEGTPLRLLVRAARRPAARRKRAR